MTVYVAGQIGETPAFAATSLERAIECLAQSYLKPGESPELLSWTCKLVDGWILQCTATCLVEGEPCDLFIEALEVDDRGCCEAAS